MFVRCKILPIRDYAEAVKVEAEVKPVRGTTIKPVGLRRNKHMQILKQDENIICRLYETDVLTYKPNGEIVIRIDGWASQTTLAFMSDLLDHPFHIFDHQVWVRVRHEGEIKNFPLRSQGENVFTRNAEGYLTLHNPVVLKVHAVNRKGANNVRARYKDFRNYIERTCKLRADAVGAVHISQEEVRDVFGDVKYIPPMVRKGQKAMPQEFEALKVLITRVSDEDKTADYYKAFLWLAHGAYHFYFHRTTRKGQMLETLDDALFYTHRDEVFNEVECFGEEKRDPYGRFF